MSAIDKLSNVRIRLLPKDIDELIKSFDDLTVKQKRIFGLYLSKKDTSPAQQRALLRTDPVWALKNIGDLWPAVQVFVLEKMIKHRVALYKKVGMCQEVSNKVVEAMLISRKVTPQMMGAIINSVPSMRMRAKIVTKYPSCVRYADGKAKLSAAAKEIVLEDHPTFGKYIVVQKVVPTSAKDKLAELRQGKRGQSAAEEKKTAKVTPAKAAPVDEEENDTPKAEPKVKPAARKSPPKAIEIEIEPEEKPVKPKAVKTPVAKPKEEVAPKSNKPSTKPKAVEKEEAKSEEDEDEEVTTPSKKVNKKVRELAEFLEESVEGFNANLFSLHAEKALNGKPAEALNKHLTKLLSELEADDVVKAAKAKKIPLVYVLLALVGDCEEYLSEDQQSQLADAEKFVESFEEEEDEPKAASKPKAEKPVAKKAQDANYPNVLAALNHLEGFDEALFEKHKDDILAGKPSPADKMLLAIIDDEDLAKKAKKAGISSAYLILALMLDEDEIELSGEPLKLFEKAKQFVASAEDSSEEDDEAAPSPGKQSEDEEEEDDEIQVTQQPKARKGSKAKAQPKVDAEEEEEDEPQEEYRPRGSRSLDLDELDVDDDISDLGFGDNDMFSGDDKPVVESKLDLDPADERKFVNMVKKAIRALVTQQQFKAKYGQSIKRSELSDLIVAKLDTLIDSSEDAKQFQELAEHLQDQVFNIAIPVEIVTLNGGTADENYEVIAGKILKLVSSFPYPALDKWEQHDAEIVKTVNEAGGENVEVIRGYPRSKGIRHANTARVKFNLGNTGFVGVFDLEKKTHVKL